MEGHVAFYLLHDLVNVSVQHGDGTELLEICESLRAIFGAPTPVRIDRPQRDVRKYHDWRAGLEVLNVIFEPLELVMAERAKSPRFQIHHVDQPNEVHAFLVKAVPARALRTLSVTVAELLAIVIQYVMLTRHKEGLLSGALWDLIDVVELFGLGQVADIASMQ